MFRTICRHCGHTWRSSVGWLGVARCPQCGRRNRRGKARDEAPEPEAKTAEERAAVAAAQPVSRPWSWSYGGPAFRWMFAVMVLLFFGVLIWLVVPPVLDFWRGHTRQIEKQSEPP